MSSVNPVSPKHSVPCFTCSELISKPFAKIFKGHLLYVMCNSQCLTVALNTLGITNSSDREFRSPVNITVSSPVNMFVNSDKSPIVKSIAYDNVNKCFDEDDDAVDQMNRPLDIDVEQIKAFGKSKLFNADLS